MENNNSEKTGRLTPGQIDAVVRISGEISASKKLIESFNMEDNRRCLYLNYSGCTVVVSSEKMADVGDDFYIIAADFFGMVKDYFTEKMSRLESELAAVISGEGGER